MPAIQLGDMQQGYSDLFAWLELIGSYAVRKRSLTSPA
jgi:hypothetical protein